MHVARRACVLALLLYFHRVGMDRRNVILDDDTLGKSPIV